MVFKFCAQILCVVGTYRHSPVRQPWGVYLGAKCGSLLCWYVHSPRMPFLIIAFSQTSGAASVRRGKTRVHLWSHVFLFSAPYLVVEVGSAGKTDFCGHAADAAACPNARRRGLKSLRLLCKTHAYAMQPLFPSHSDVCAWQMTPLLRKKTRTAKQVATGCGT